jgi:hypothetical protein
VWGVILGGRWRSEVGGVVVTSLRHTQRGDFDGSFIIKLALWIEVRRHQAWVFFRGEERSKV